MSRRLYVCSYENTSILDTPLFLCLEPPPRVGKTLMVADLQEERRCKQEHVGIMKSANDKDQEN